MPIFQDDIDHNDLVEPPTPDVNYSSHRLRRLSEESISTELCEGPLPDSPQRPAAPEPNRDDPAVSDRAALIERLKRAQSPTWITNGHVCHEVLRLLSLSACPNTNCIPQLGSILQHHAAIPATRRPQTPSDPSSLLSPTHVDPEQNDDQAQADERFRNGFGIERPRSALHSGDFTEEALGHNRRPRTIRPHLDTRHIENEIPWIATSPPRHFVQYHHDQGLPFFESVESFQSNTSPLSSSLSSSFVYKPPTSPLVQSESYDEHDVSMPQYSFNFSSRFDSMRNTPNSAVSSPFVTPSSRSSLPPRIPHRRESFPYQAHQPRRSLTSTPSFIQSDTSPQTPALLRSRRSSLALDSSLLHHASMVGSYEESILRGRMSTTPSKPLEFLVQIGVLGKGNCKSSLKCPPHVTLSFQAVYYSYNNTSHGRSRTDDGPSPYVGQVDLENGLPNPDDEQRAKRKAQSRHADRRAAENNPGCNVFDENPDQDLRRNSRPKRKTGTAKTPPGGSYRIPEKGQIQIIIKNQNKTAVKLFLVPYDLSGMEPGTKTFIRQRIYSQGPIMDDVPAASELDSMDRPILRYLVHLHICSPSKDRFYLYKSIRIVFANRVPDGKEKLRNETTWPEPRFSPYKAIRVMHPPVPAQSGPAAILVADKASRRRSAGIYYGSSSRKFEAIDGGFSETRSSGGFAAGNTLPIAPIPFHLPGRERVGSDVSDSTNTTAAVTVGLRSPGSSQASRPSTKDSTNAMPWGPTLYEKLNKGDLGYGGNAFNLSGAAGALNGVEGLLSQRLRSLGMKQPSPPDIS